MKRKWDPEKYKARKALSSILDRPVRLVRFEKGSSGFNQGQLQILDADTGALIATVHPLNLRDPKTGWDLRTDC